MIINKELQSCWRKLYSILNLALTLKPEDIVMELMKNQGTQPDRRVRQSMVNDFQSDKTDHDEDEDDDDDDDSEIDDEDDDAGAAFLPPSTFLTMVQ